MKPSLPTALRSLLPRWVSGPWPMAMVLVLVMIALGLTLALAPLAPLQPDHVMLSMAARDTLIALSLVGIALSLFAVKRATQACHDLEATQQQLTHQLAERTRELAAAHAANAVQGRFLASVSHDLRQPVAAIGLITELLRVQVADPTARSLADRLSRAVRSMEGQIKGLQDLSRLSSGGVAVQRQRVRLQTLLEAVDSHEAEAARHKGLQLRVRQTPAVAWTDPVLLEQALRHLVGNAIRHTQQGGVLVTVRRRGGSPSAGPGANEGVWLVQVWDTGPGIRAEDQSRIGEAFTQTGSPGLEPSREMGPLGLGLTVAQRAAHMLQHPVHLRSRVGRGSCFAVSLPSARPTPPVSH